MVKVSLPRIREVTQPFFARKDCLLHPVPANVRARYAPEANVIYPAALNARWPAHPALVLRFVNKVAPRYAPIALDAGGLAMQKLCLHGYIQQREPQNDYHTIPQFRAQLAHRL